MQGNVDLSFRIKGHKGREFTQNVLCRVDHIHDNIAAGTLYFTSIRKAKGEPFTIRMSHSMFVSPPSLNTSQSVSVSSVTTGRSLKSHSTHSKHEKGLPV